MKLCSLVVLCLLNIQFVMAQTSDLLNLPTGNDDGFIVIAHRGASAYAPENTHSAFKLAIEMKAEMIELDVSITKDGVPVVVHDETVDRTTSASGAVGSFTLAELKELETGAWFGKEFEGEPFPTLEEVLAYIDGNIALNIEIKTEAVTDVAEGGVVDKSVQLVKKGGVEDQIIFSSFDYRVMEHLNKLAPEMPKALLYEKSQSGDLLPSELVAKYKVDAFNCSHRQLSKKWVADLNDNNIPFLVYTVNDEKLMRKVIEKGAAGIFSDKPDLLKKVVENL